MVRRAKGTGTDPGLLMIIPPASIQYWGGGGLGFAVHDFYLFIFSPTRQRYPFRAGKCSLEQVEPTAPTEMRGNVASRSPIITRMPACLGSHLGEGGDVGYVVDVGSCGCGEMWRVEQSPMGRPFPHMPNATDGVKRNNAQTRRLLTHRQIPVCVREEKRREEKKKSQYSTVQCSAVRREG